MTTDNIKELVKRLRDMLPQSVGPKAADALEALAGLVKILQDDASIILKEKGVAEECHQHALTLAKKEMARAEAAESERDRLKAAITEALNNAQDRLDYDCKCKDCTGTLTTVEATLRAALGDAS